MATSAIPTLERYIVDSIVSSRQIPSAVTVRRFATGMEEEGAVQQTSNISVIYTSSFSNVKNRDPLVVERTYNFELRFTVQSYLTKAAHDFATELLGTVEGILNQGVPFGEFSILEPFRLESERFMGITSNTQYQYSQVWRIVVGTTYENAAQDPCVRQGNCTAVWPPENVLPSTEIPETIPPGAVINQDGKVLLPCPPIGADCEPRTYLFEDDLFLCDGTLLVADWGLSIYSLEVRSKNTDGTYRVEVIENSSGNVIQDLQYCDTKYRVAALNIDLWRSPINYAGVESTSVLDWNQLIVAKDYRLAIVILPTIFSSDPTSQEDSAFARLADGRVIAVDPNVTLTVGSFTWVAAVIDKGTMAGWILDDDKWKFCD